MIYNVAKKTKIPVTHDFRTDTITTPLPEMISSISTIEWGDSVFDEDPSTSELENYVAELTGKEAGLFCVSGTLSNQLAVRVNLQVPPHSIVCDERAHIYKYEAGGLATLSQAMVSPVKPSNGKHVTLEDIKPHIMLEDDIHCAPTRLVELENTMWGCVIPLEEIKRISEYARAHGLRMHLDGARIWNASAETGIPLKEYCQYFDTVSLCLSKGLCSPVGSILVGSTADIKKAAWFRKQQGGGIRQAGWLAKSALIAIDKVWPTMKNTHEQTRRLAQMLKDVGVKLHVDPETNMIFPNLEATGISPEAVTVKGLELGVNVFALRIVLSYWTSEEALALVQAAFKAVIDQK